MLTKAKVEKVAMLKAVLDSATKRLESLKFDVRQSLIPTQKVKGYASFVHLTEEPVIAKVVDYRAELVKQVGEARVASMEAKAAKKVLIGTPRVLTGMVEADNIFNALRAGTIRNEVVRSLQLDIQNP